MSKRPNGAGSYYEKNGHTVIQWCVGKRRHTRTFKNRSEAIRELDRITTGGAACTPVTLVAYAADWLEARAGKRSYYQDTVRWNKHLAPLAANLRSDAVTVAVIKGWLKALREKGLSNASIRLCMALLSAMYSDLVEEGRAAFNPTKMLSKKTRAEYLKSSHDPRKVPFLPYATDSYRVYVWLLENRGKPIATAYALGAFAGLRTSEARALQWTDVNFERKVLTVAHSVEQRKGRTTGLSPKGLVPTKNGIIRVVPIFDILYPILESARSLSDDLLVCLGPARQDHLLPFLREATIAAAITDALHALGIPVMSFYQATRHTFASQWIMAHGNIHTLSTMLGHHSVTVTEAHYIHLTPEYYTHADRSRFAV